MFSHIKRLVQILAQLDFPIKSMDKNMAERKFAIYSIDNINKFIKACSDLSIPIQWDAKNVQSSEVNSASLKLKQEELNSQEENSDMVSNINLNPVLHTIVSLAQKFASNIPLELEEQESMGIGRMKKSTLFEQGVQVEMDKTGQNSAIKELLQGKAANAKNVFENNQVGKQDIEEYGDEDVDEGLDEDEIGNDEELQGAEENIVSQLGEELVVQKQQVSEEQQAAIEQEQAGEDAPQQVQVVSSEAMQVEPLVDHQGYNFMEDAQAAQEQQAALDELPDHLKNILDGEMELLQENNIPAPYEIVITHTEDGYIKTIVGGDERTLTIEYVLEELDASSASASIKSIRRVSTRIADHQQTRDAILQADPEAVVEQVQEEEVVARETPMLLEQETAQEQQQLVEEEKIQVEAAKPIINEPPVKQQQEENAPQKISEKKKEQVNNQQQQENSKSAQPRTEENGSSSIMYYLLPIVPVVLAVLLYKLFV